MKVLIYEPHPGGHRFEYVSRILPTLSDLGVRVSIATSGIGLASIQYEVHLSGLSDSFEPIPCSDDALTAGSQWARSAASYRELRRVVSDVKPDHLYFPAADGVTQVASLSQLTTPCGSDELCSEALHFAGGFGYELPNRLRQLRRRFEMYLVTHSPWTNYWHTDPWQLAAIRSRYPSFTDRSMLLPDPVEPSSDVSREEARTRLGIPEDGKYFGMLGPVSSRKRLDLLLAAFRQAMDGLSNWRLLVAGSLDATAKALVKEHEDLLRQGRLIVLDKYFDASEMNLLVPAVDAAVVPYEGHFGSSGVVLRAAAASRPVLASDIHWLGRTVQRFGLGKTCDIHDGPVFGNALIQVAELAADFQLSAVAHRYLAFQSVENFRASWVAKLRQRMGLPEDPSRIDWTTVIKS